MASTLFEYYQSVGKPFPTSLSGRFSDSAFADAARRAGISQSSYTGSAQQNNAILSALQSVPSPMGSAANSGNTNTTGTAANSSNTNTTGTTKTSTSLKDLSIGMSNGSIKTQADLVARGGSPNTGSANQIYLDGDYSLVRFTGEGNDQHMNSQKVWLLDSKTRTLRPFSSGSALANFFDGDVNLDDIKEIPASELNPGGQLGSNGGKPGYQLLSSEYAIQSDGSARKLDYSASELAARYGQPINQEMEQTMFSALKGMFRMFEEAGVNKNEINKIKNNAELMAFYVSATTYGGYSVGDVYSDVKKREQGINNLSPISATADKTAYANTSEYQKASADTRIQPPSNMAGMNTAEMNLRVYDLPDELFKTLVPLLDYDSQEFKDAMASVETSYYDLLEQQLNATTQQEKAIADYNYQEFKNEVEKNFGIALSDNALEAWNQIQQTYNQGAQAGTFGSGLQNEGIDSYLRSVRRQDQRARADKVTGEERQKMQYFLTAATTQEIKDLVNSDPETAKRWGLVPSDEIKDALSLSKLKEKYPNAKEEDLAQYISILLDENGNYRSQIYQKQMGTLGDLDPNSASMNTITGLDTNKEQFQIGETYRKELLKEEDAYKTFTQPDVAFLRANDKTAFENVTGTKATPETENLSKSIKSAIGNLPKPADTPAPVTTKSPVSTVTPPKPTVTPPKPAATPAPVAPKPATSSKETIAETYAKAQAVLAKLAPLPSSSSSSGSSSKSTSSSSSASKSTSSLPSSKPTAASKAKATRLANGAKR